jgi:hypothetical protein
MRRTREDQVEGHRQSYGSTADQVLERRRLKRLEQWSKTPLDPAVEEALNGVAPGVAWSYLQCVLFQAFYVHPAKAEELMQKYEPAYDEQSLDVMLQNLNPKVGLKHFLGCGKIVDLSDLIHKADPLEVLEHMLWMVSLSSEWQSDLTE